MPAGRPSHEPTDETREKVLDWSKCGTRQDQMASELKISKDTLRKHYRSELDTGMVMANAAVARNLFEIATSKEKGAVTAAIFWLKTRAGWKETMALEVSDPSVGTNKPPDQCSIDENRKNADLVREYLAEQIRERKTIDVTPTRRTDT